MSGIRVSARCRQCRCMLLILTVAKPQENLVRLALGRRNILNKQ